MPDVTRLYFIRHGQAAAGWGEAADPGLDEVGRAQAAEVAADLNRFGAMPVVTSPLARARETAAAFESLWGVTARVEPRVAEIPAPTRDLNARAAWLVDARKSNWSDLDGIVRHWRDGVVAALTELTESTVITSHFLAINAAVSVAAGVDKVEVFQPDNGSCTVLDVVDGRLKLVQLGRERETRVN